jgi:protein phosphatase
LTYVRRSRKNNKDKNIDLEPIGLNSALFIDKSKESKNNFTSSLTAWPGNECNKIERQNIYAESSLTDIGLKRENNEDALFSNVNKGLFIIADGMGGHAAGEVASNIAVKTASAFILEEIEKLENYTKNSDSFTKTERMSEIYGILYKALRKANVAVRKESNTTPKLKGMGTTLTIMLLDRGMGDDRIYFASIGDSRIYILKADSMNALTNDHTMAQELVNRGYISKDDACTSPFKNRLTKYIGGISEKSITEDCFGHTSCTKGDMMLMCSDGLTDMLTDKEICEIIVKENIKSDGQIPIKKQVVDTICESLVKQSNSKGGRDNITIIVIKNLGLSNIGAKTIG